MQRIELRYKLLFFVSSSLTVLFIVGGWYQIVADSDHYWKMVRLPWWLVVPFLIFATGYSILAMVITSYELAVDDHNFEIKRPWSDSKKHQFIEIERVLRVTRRHSLIRLKDGSYIPLSGMTPNGTVRKERIEKSLNDRLSMIDGTDTTA